MGAKIPSGDNSLVSRVLHTLGRIHALGELSEDDITGESEEHLPRGKFIASSAEWLIKRYPSPALAQVLVDDINEMYNSGTYTGQSNMFGYPWHTEDKEFVESLNYVLKLADKEEVEKLKGIAEIVCDARYIANGVLEIATEVQQYSYVADILRKMIEDAQTPEDWKEIRGFCHGFLLELLEMEKQGQEIPGFEVNYYPEYDWWYIERRPPGIKTRWQMEREIEAARAVLVKIKGGQLSPDAIRDLREFDRHTLAIALRDVLPMELHGRQVSGIEIRDGIPVFVSVEKVPDVIVPISLGADGGIGAKVIRFVCVYWYDRGWKEDEERGMSRYKEIVAQAIQSWGQYREEARNLYRIAQERKYKPGWVYYRLKERYGNYWANLLMLDMQLSDQEWYERHIVQEQGQR